MTPNTEAGWRERPRAAPAHFPYNHRTVAEMDELAARTSNRRDLIPQIIALHEALPSWDAEQIATALECSISHVRDTAYRHGLKLPRKAA